MALVLLLFLFLATTYSIVTPVFEGFDEHWHFAFVDYVARHGRLPRQPAERYPHLARQEASQPPLYYWLASAATWWIPTGDLSGLLRENPQFAPVPRGYRDNQNLIVHTEAESFPYQGTSLAVHLSRMVSVLLGTGTVYCVYALTRLLVPGRTALAFGAMLLTALTPSFLFASALVNNDILTAFLASLALVLLAGIWQGRYSRTAGIWLGLVLGCAALSKLSGLLLWPFSALVLVAASYQRRDWRILARVGLPALGVALAVSGWWYARNWVLYDDITGLNQMLEIVGRREAGFGLREALAEMEGVRRSYWALFGWFNVSVEDRLYRVYDAVSLLGLAGLAVFAGRAIRQHRRDQIAVILFLSAWPVIVTAGLLIWTQLTTGSQGRLLYPAIGPIALLLSLGWSSLAPRHRTIWWPAAIGAGLAFLAFAVYVPFFVIVPAYAHPTLLQPGEAAQPLSEELRVEFEEGVTLLGYDLNVQETRPGEVLWVTLCWEGSQVLETDYLLFVQLLVDNDLIAAQKDTYHGLGTFPTSLWPTGARFCEEYPLRVADTVPAPGKASLSIGLYGAEGRRLQAWAGSGQPLGDNVRLAGPTIRFPEGGRSLEYEFGHRVALIDYRLGSTALTPGESLSISLVWSAIQPARQDYVATVQVLDEQGAKIGQSDVPLPASTWIGDASVTDRREVAISPEATSGVYAIRVAVYDPATVQNLPVYRSREALGGGGLLTLWTVRVLPRLAGGL